MRLVKKHPSLVIFILGLLLRFSLLFFDFGWDVNNHLVWAKDLWQRGFVGFYEKQSSEVYASIYPNYPPLSIFIFYLFYPLQSIVGKVAWYINITVPLFPSKLIFFVQSRTFLAAMLKLPAVFADLGIALICCLIARKTIPNNPKIQKLTTIFILFNPAFFFNSALWGQIDSIPIFFVLVSIYLLLFTRYNAVPGFTQESILSSLFFVLAVLVKPTALVYLPIYIIFFIRKYKIINFLKAALLSFLLFYLSFVPFLKNFNNPLLPFLIFSEKIMAAQSLPYVTNGAFNFWVLITGFAGIKDTAPFLLGISYRFWGYFITGFFTLFILSSLWKQGSRNLIDSRWSLPRTSLRGGNDIIYRFFYAAFLIAFASFLFLTKMHERYSMLPLPFLLLAGLKNKKLLKLFVVLSSISLLNLYHSWPVPKLGFITGFFYYPHFAIAVSLVNVLIFLYFLTTLVVVRQRTLGRTNTF